MKITPSKSKRIPPTPGQPSPWVWVLGTCLGALASMPAAAQYKVVAPDGTVTYTDRPPPSAPAPSVTPMSRSGANFPVGGDASLPLELRQASSRYPVVLYATASCQPCDSARQFLQQRGVPYSERSVGTEADAVALERAVGARSVPALTIGTQVLRSFAQDDWTAYLNAAGYPKESRLPRGWQAPAATPLVARAAPAPVAPVAAPRTQDASPPVAPPASGIRF